MKHFPVEHVEPSIPFLYEVWNWVGDTSILPIKWLEFLHRADSNRFGHLTREQLLSNYVTQPNFDPYGFFFITNRSDVAAAVLVWPTSGEECEMREFAVAEKHRDKGVGEALVDLAHNYALSKGFRCVVCDPGPCEFTANLLRTRGYN